MSLEDLLLTLKARGNWGHEGRPGKRGGSLPRSNVVITNVLNNENSDQLISQRISNFTEAWKILGNSDYGVSIRRNPLDDKEGRLESYKTAGYDSSGTVRNGYISSKLTDIGGGKSFFTSTDGLVFRVHVGDKNSEGKLENLKTASVRVNNSFPMKSHIEEYLKRGTLPR